MTTETVAPPASTPTTITVNGHALTLPEYFARVRKQEPTIAWIPGDDTHCDVWVAARALDAHHWVLEGEVSNASFAPGVPARPTTACHVGIRTPEGFGVGSDLTDLPGSLQPQRAALWRAIISTPDAPALSIATLDDVDPKWADNFGPLGAKMPRDQFPDTGAALEEAYAFGGVVQHADFFDSLNLEAFRQFGPKNIAVGGGSDIQFGYSWHDARAVRVIARALTNRALHAYDRRTGEPITVEYYGAVTPNYDASVTWLPEFKDVSAGIDYEWREFDPEHRQRQNLYMQVWWSMTRSPLAERQLVHAGERARLQMSERGVVNFEPGFTPINLHQYHEMALRDPHHGLPGPCGRYFGWLGWAWAWRLLVRPRDASRAFGQVFLNTMELGASLTHGFVQRGERDMALDPAHPEVLTHVTDVAQCFELGMLGHAVLAIARLSGQPVPIWLQRAVNTVYMQDPMTYSGMPTPPHVLKWKEDGTLVPAPGTDGDPAFGWIEELCAALFLGTKNGNFLMMSCKYHAPAPNWNAKVAAMNDFPDDQDKRECIEARGIGALK